MVVVGGDQLSRQAIELTPGDVRQAAPDRQAAIDPASKAEHHAAL